LKTPLIIQQQLPDLADSIVLIAIPVSNVMVGIRCFSVIVSKGRKNFKILVLTLDLKAGDLEDQCFQGIHNNF
jgi:hypothetical protein